MFAGSKCLSIPSVLGTKGICLAILFSVVATLLPNTAQAACGDYLTIAGRPMEKHAPRPVASQIPTTAGFPALPAPTPVCQGPNCGRQPVQPVAPPALPTSLQLDDLALIDSATLQRRDNVICFEWTDSLVLKSTPIDEIFHPPRG